MKLKFSLYFSLALLSSTAALISVVGLGGYIAYRQGEQVKQAAEYEARLITTGLTTVFSEDLVIKNYSGIEQTLIQSTSYPSILNIKVINNQGKVIVEGRRESPEGNWHLTYATNIDIPPGQQLKSVVQDKRIITWAPVVTGDIVGWICTEMSLSHVANLNNKIIYDTSVVAVISLFSSMLIVILVLRKPIIQIRHATKFAEKLPYNYGQLIEDHSSTKEIENLINALNTASKKLHEQDQDLNMMRALFEFSNDPVYVLDPDDGFRMIFANNATCKHYGLSREKLLTMRVPDWDTNMDSTQLDLFRSKIEKQGSLTFLSEHRIANGEIIPVEISANYIRFSDQDFVAGYFRDVRERVRAEYELKQSRDIAQKSAKVKSEFLANMSHEIRTPMNGIIGLTHLALNEPLTVEARDCLNKIAFSSESLLVILNDILELSRLEAGRVTIDCLPFDLTHLIKQLKNLFEESARVKNLDFIIKFTNELSAQVLGDPTRIQQVLSNLLGNAIKFTENGFVGIFIHSQKISNDKILVIFSVKDSGIGIASEDLKKLFQPFSQVDTSITRRFGGTGLGLAISRHLLQRMGGDFSVVSELGVGTTISFALEFEIASNVEDVINQKASNSQSGDLKNTLKAMSASLEGKQVLIVEDNRINQKVVSGFLTMSGMKVSIAENGQEALEMIYQQPFDAVLMDIQMPIMDGKEATSILRQNPDFQSLPVIALTAAVTDEERDIYLKVGLNDIVAKPIKPDILIAMLKKWISGNG